MSWLRRLLGLSEAAAVTPAAAEAVEHEGFTIAPAPIAEAGQFRLCAMISREIGGIALEHKLIRADVFGSRDEAAEAAIRKAKQLIKEQGERLFQ